MLYIYLLCLHSEHQNNSFQSKQSKHFHQRNRFTLCETGSNKVKLPKVGSNVIVPVPWGRAQQNKYSWEGHFHFTLNDMDKKEVQLIFKFLIFNF